MTALLKVRGLTRSFGGVRAVDDVSFDLSRGELLALLGPNGAGKSTCFNMINGQLKPDAGEVLLDARDVREYRIADLRKQFAVVLQEPVLFATSIAENIAYGKPDASDDEIVAAAKAAASHDFILHLPEGYETQVGERGSRLSGGERQRISLARAFLRNSPILILDEPTSSVDIHTEAAIMEATERLMSGRTTFMIAHRMSTLKSCDLVLVLEKGRLVEVKQCAPEAWAQTAN